MRVGRAASGGDTPPLTDEELERWGIFVKHSFAAIS